MRMCKITAALRCAVVLAVALPMLGGVATARSPRTYTIVMDTMAFGAVPAELHRGDTIRWVNRDLFRHSASAKDRSFDIDLMPGHSAIMALKRPGTIAFSCKYHPGMKGTLKVAP
jgi:plastocyanin